MYNVHIGSTGCCFSIAEKHAHLAQMICIICSHAMVYVLTFEGRSAPDLVTIQLILPRGTGVIRFIYGTGFLRLDL